jgi:hypothetical protein
MATTKGALFSLEASGKFADSVVYDRRGRARAYTIPANPKSAAQGDARQRLAATQAALKIAGSTAIEAMKAVAAIGYLWNSNMVKETIGTGHANFDASSTAFAALTGPQQTDWSTTFSDVHVPLIEYAAIDPVSSGKAAFCLCRALYASGAISSPGTPAAGNHAAWHAALVA